MYDNVWDVDFKGCSVNYVTNIKEIFENIEILQLFSN
jgi:hypothetical protein